MTLDDVPDGFYSKVKTVIDDLFPGGLPAWAASHRRVPKDELHEAAVQLVLAMIPVEDKDKIKPKDRWRRRRKALRTAAAKATRWGELVQGIADEVHATDLSGWTTKRLNSIYSFVYDDFERFRAICEETAFMVVTDAQYIRDQEFDDGEDFEEQFEAQAGDIFGLDSEMDFSDKER